MNIPTGDITLLLQLWREGNPEAEDQLFTLALPYLRRLAHHRMKLEPKDLQSTELIGEAYIRLVGAKDRDWQNRVHFFAMAARFMRRYLIEVGRKRRKFEPLDGWENFLRAASYNIDLAIELDGLLEELAKTKPEWATLVEMKVFLGLTDEETADAMGMKLRTVQRTWRDAKRWLFERMKPGDDPSEG